MAYALIIVAGCAISYFTGNWMAAFLFAVVAFMGVDIVKLGGQGERK